MQVDNYRPYMEQMKRPGAVGVYEISAQDPTPIVQAMKNVGYNPAWILYSAQFYGPQATRRRRPLGSFPPSYVQFGAIPFDLASQYPVVQQVINIVHGAVPNAKLTTFTLVLDERLAAVGRIGHGVRVEPHRELRAAEGAEHSGLDRRRALPAAEPAAGPPARLAVHRAGQAHPQRVRLRQEGHPARPGMSPFNCDPANVKTRQDLHPNLLRSPLLPDLAERLRDGSVPGRDRCLLSG